MTPEEKLKEIDKYIAGFEALIRDLKNERNKIIIVLQRKEKDHE